MNACRSVCGVIGLAIPARRAVRRTICPAPCRPSRRAPGARNTGPSACSPMARSIALGGARRQRDGHHLAALAGDRQGPVTALQAQVLDVGAGSFRYPQPVQGEQRDQRVLEWRPEGQRLPAAPSSLRSRATTWDSQSTRGRRTCAAGERSKSSSWTAYLQHPAMADSRRVTVARGRPLASRSQAKVSMPARRTANRATERVRHQLVSWRRSRAQASRVRPRYPARNPARATRSAWVKTGWIVASAADGTAVVIGHLPAGLEPGSWASPGPSSSTETHRKLPGPGHATPAASGGIPRRPAREILPVD
jgi:hypothetical protein